MAETYMIYQHDVYEWGIRKAQRTLCFSCAVKAALNKGREDEIILVPASTDYEECATCETIIRDRVTL